MLPLILRLASRESLVKLRLAGMKNADGGGSGKAIGGGGVGSKEELQEIRNDVAATRKELGGKVQAIGEQVQALSQTLNELLKRFPEPAATV